MNQTPGGWGTNFNPMSQGISQRFGLQLGGAGMNMMNQTGNPRFGNAAMNPMQRFGGPRFGGGNVGFGMGQTSNFGGPNFGMNNPGFNLQARLRAQNQGMGNVGFGPGMRFGVQNTGMRNTGFNQGPRFGGQNKDMESAGASPAKMAKKDTKGTRDAKPGIEAKMTKKETKSTTDSKPGIETKTAEKETKSMSDPKPDIEKLRKYHIPKKDSSKDEDSNNKSEKTNSAPVSLMGHSFNAKPKTDNYNKRLNENTRGPKLGMDVSRNKEQNSSYNVTKPVSNIKAENMLDRNKAAENRKEPASLMALSFNPAQHGVRHSEQSVQGMDNSGSMDHTRGPMDFVQSKESLRSVPMKKNLSFVDSEQDQDSDAEEGNPSSPDKKDEDQEGNSSESDGDWDDEGVPAQAFNPLPTQLVTDTGMPRQLITGKKKELLSGNFVKGKILVKEDIDPLGRLGTQGGIWTDTSYSVEKNNKPSLLNIEFYPPIDPSNIGHRLLQKMGWTIGTGLGVTRGGIQKPVTAGGRLGGRHGLGGMPLQERTKKLKKKDKDQPFDTLKTLDGKDNMIQCIKELLKHFNNGTKTPVCVVNEYLARRQRRAMFKLPVGLEENSTDKSFARQCVVGGKFYETGTGENKKAAKNAAATIAFKSLVRELYQEIGMTVPLEIETQLNKVPETQIQRKPSRWSTPIIHQKREDLLTRQPDPIEKQKLTLTPDIEALVKKFYEGMKHATNALTECCLKQSIKLEFKDVDGTEQQRHGSRIYLDDVEYGYASANNKKSAKSDAALIAFVAFVKDVYTNSDKPLPNSFAALCRLGLSRLEQVEAIAKAKSKAESLAKLQNMQPKKSILKRGPSYTHTQTAEAMKWNQAPNQGLQGPLVPNQGLPNWAPNQRLQGPLAPNQRLQGPLALNQGLQNQVPNQRLQNQGPNQGLQNEASRSWDQTQNPRQARSQNEESMSWNQNQNPRLRLTQSEGSMNQGLQRTQNGLQRQAPASDKRGWQEIPPPNMYSQSKFSKSTAKANTESFGQDKPSGKKKTEGSNAISFYEAERIINSKLEKEWELAEPPEGSEMPTETISKLFKTQKKKPIMKMNFEKPVKKVDYTELVHQASKNYGKKSSKDSQDDTKEEQPAPWKSKKPAAKPVESSKKATWSRQTLKRPASTSSLDSCQAYQGLGSILQRLADDGEIETENNNQDAQPVNPKFKRPASMNLLNKSQPHQGLGSLLQRLSGEGSIERDYNQDTQPVNPKLRRPASMTALDRRGNQGSLRSRLTGIASGYGENHDQDNEYGNSGFGRGGGFPRGPFPPQHRFPQQGINNPFMMRQPRPSWQNPGGPGINRSLMNMEMIPSKPFMAVKPMMSQDFGLSHQGNDQMGTIKPLLPQGAVPGQGSDSSMLMPPSYKVVQLFYSGAKKALPTLKEYCQQNKIKVNFKAGSFEKWQSTGMFERRCEINGKLYEVGEGSTKKEAEEEASLLAFRAILREFNLDQG